MDGEADSVTSLDWTEKRDLPEEEDDEETVLKRCSQQPVLAGDSSSVEGDFESGSSSDESEGRSAVEEDAIDEGGSALRPTLPHPRRSRIKQKKLVFTSAEPMKGDNDTNDIDIAEFRRQIPDANFDLIHQVDWEEGILWDVSDPTRMGGSMSDQQARCQLIELDSESEQSHLSDDGREHPTIDQREVGLNANSSWQRPGVVEPLSQRHVEEDEDELIVSPKSLRHPQMLRLQSRSFDNEFDGAVRAELLKRISNMTLEVKEKNQELACGDWLNGIFWGDLEPPVSRSKVSSHLQSGISYVVNVVYHHFYRSSVLLCF